MKTVKDLSFLDTRYYRFSGWKRRIESACKDLEDAYANGEVSESEFPVVVYSKKSGRFAIFAR